MQRVLGVVFTGCTILLPTMTHASGPSREARSPPGLRRATACQPSLGAALCECEGSHTHASRGCDLMAASTAGANCGRLNMQDEVVLVTGGAGFLGQHVIRMLQERVSGVKEIRVFDVKQYQNKLGHTEVIPVKSIVGDLRRQEDVQEALEGVDSVIHTAGVISFGTFPDLEAMEEVNVKGTSNVITGCLEQGVKHLVHTSTVDVVIGYQPITDGDETLPVPPTFLFTGYPDTKCRAEQLVLGANTTPLKPLGVNQCLHTLSLRPNVMYGELDRYYVVSALKSAADNRGVLIRVGDGAAKFQQAYAGNVAWAHICALHALKTSAGDVSGKAYFITDDTPVMNSFTFMQPFLEARGLSLSSYSVPYALVYSAMGVAELALRMISPLYKVNLSTSLSSIIYINMDVYFNRSRAEQLLHYKPLFNYEESLEKSLRYYKHFSLQSDVN